MKTFLTLLALLAACARPDHIEIDPSAPRLTRKGETVRLHGKLMDRSGKVFSGERAAWSSRDPFIASVDANGEVAALSSGHTVLTATWSELTATLPVDVDLVEALRIDRALLDLPVSSEPVKLGVTPLGLDGRPQRDREVHLASRDPAIARVDPEGKVWPVAAGDTVVQARLDDKEAEIAVHVH